MTVCGGWSAYQCNATGIRAITLWCRSWLCPDCAPKRVSNLKFMAMDGQPTTFITLTVNPATNQDPTARARELSDAWKLVVKRARRKFTKAPIEYMAVFEETKKGEPHLHILARAPFIPQQWLSEQMNELICAPIVDIRKVGNKHNAAKYVAKYVGKGPKAFAALKRYWSSQNYDLSEKQPPSDADVTWNGWHVEHMSSYLLIEHLGLSHQDVEWNRQEGWFHAHGLRRC